MIDTPKTLPILDPKMPSEPATQPPRLPVRSAVEHAIMRLTPYETAHSQVDDVIDYLRTLGYEIRAVEEATDADSR